MRRNIIFKKGEIYHICNKSIADYGIFEVEENVLRFLSLLEYRNDKENGRRFSYFLKSNKYTYINLLTKPELAKVKFLAYCIMKDHYHLLVKALDDDISNFMGQIENGYSHFFNIKYKRKGPLWQSRFRCVRVTTNEQLLHVSRYIHLNPATSKYVDKPEDWKYSSYNDFINGKALKELDEISIQNPKYYKKFCEDQIGYQQSLKIIKTELLE